MIRLSKKSEQSDIISLAESTKLFDKDQLNLLNNMFEATIEASDSKEAVPFWLTDDNSGVKGVAYCEPERMTDGTWNLQFIGVHPSIQKEKRGTGLLAAVEAEVLKRNGRILIVETAGIEEFDYVRKFYLKNGYTQESRIRDFYASRIDKITFWKSLKTA